MNKSDGLGNVVTKSLSSGTIIDLLKEYGEVGVDAILKEGALKDIPIINTIVALAKTGVSISDRILINKIMKFLTPMSQLTEDERQEMIEKLETDPAYGRKVGEHLVELLDKIDSDQKPGMIAAVFIAYAKGEIDIDMLNRLNVATESLPSFEVHQVRQFHGMQQEDRANMNVVTLQALMTAGLASAVSGWGCLVYQPSEVCEAFLKLNLDACN